MMTLLVVEDWNEALMIIRDVMGWWHEYYAEASKSIGARGLVLKVDDVSVGSIIYYKVVLPSLSIGVIYYVVVRLEYRGRGYGKILVNSAEDLLAPVDLTVATIDGNNRSSMAMFNSLSYKLFKWDELDKVNEDLSEVIYRVTCSYEDDIVAVKTSADINKLRITQDDITESMKVWNLACYEPWKKLKRRRSLV